MEFADIGSSMAVSAPSPGSKFTERHLYASLTGLVLRRTCLAQREIRSFLFLAALCQSVGHGVILCRYVSLAINVSDPNQYLICFTFCFSR